MARLVAKSPTAEAFKPVIDVPLSGIVLGRAAHGHDAVLAPATWQQVSNKHFRLQASKEGLWSIEDLSRNGTFVDGQKLQKGSRQQLHGGEVIKISIPFKDSNAALVEWQFVTVDSLESGAACEPDSHSAQAQDHTTDQNADILAAPASGSKRKAEVSPPSVKRQRGSDGGSWALEQNAKLRQELQDQHEAHLKELTALKQKAKEERAQLAAQLADTEKQLASAGKQDAMSTAVEEAAKKLEEKDAHIEGLEAKLHLSEAAGNDAKRSSEAARAECATLRAEHKELQDRCAALEGELKSQVRSSREEAKALQDELSNVKATLSEASGARRKAENEIEKLLKAQQAAAAALEEFKKQAALAAASAKANSETLQSQLEEAILERKAAQGREAYMRHDLEAKQFVVRDMHEAFCSIVDARQRARKHGREEAAGLQAAMRARECRLQAEAASLEDIRSLGEKFTFALGQSSAAGANTWEATQASQGATDAAMQDATERQHTGTAAALSAPAGTAAETQLADRNQSQAGANLDASPPGDPAGDQAGAALPMPEGAAEASGEIPESKLVGGQDTAEDIVQDSDASPPAPKENCPPAPRQPALTPKRAAEFESPSKSFLSSTGRRTRSQAKSPSQKP